jgi:hypothetical protein
MAAQVSLDAGRYAPGAMAAAAVRHVLERGHGRQ